MLGDVGDPQLIRAPTSEATLDQVGCDVVRLDAAPLRSPGDADDPGPVHQQLDRAVSNLHAVTQDEFGVHASRAVNAPRVGVDLADQVGQPRMTDRALRRRPGQPLVGTRLGYLEHPDGDLHRQALGGHHLDRREPPVGSLRSPASFNSSTARRATTSSVSSSWMRLFAAVSSDLSALLRPGTSPLSMRS